MNAPLISLIFHIRVTVRRLILTTALIVGMATACRFCAGENHLTDMVLDNLEVMARSGCGNLDPDKCGCDLCKKGQRNLPTPDTTTLRASEIGTVNERMMDPPTAFPSRAPDPVNNGTGVSGDNVSSSAGIDIVADVKIAGNKRPATDVLRMIQTRAGREFDPRLVEADVRRLISSKQFLDVRPTVQRTAKGMIITFNVHERNLFTEVKIVGSHDLYRNDLLKKIELRKGDPADPYTVQQGKIVIENYYKEEGYGKINVEIFEGDKPGDHRAIYVIHEGPKQKIFRVKFEGNHFASDGQLETKIQSRPGILWLFGGKVNRDQIQQDVEALEGYYHNFGFFQAEVSRDLDWDDHEKWLTLTFHINEGIRSKVRSIELAGNQRFDEDYLLPLRSITEGDDFCRDKLERDAVRIQNSYGEQGYVLAKVQPRVQMFEEPGEVGITYAIREDKQYRWGKIDPKIIAGDGDPPRTRWEVVLDPLNIYPGQIANRSELLASKRRMMTTNTFETDPEKSPDIAFGRPTRTPAKSSVGPLTPEPVGIPDGSDRETMIAERPDGYRGQSPTTPIPPTTAFEDKDDSTTIQRYQSPLADAVDFLPNPCVIRFPETTLTVNGSETTDDVPMVIVLPAANASWTAADSVPVESTSQRVANVTEYDDFGRPTRSNRSATNIPDTTPNTAANGAVSPMNRTTNVPGGAGTNAPAPANGTTLVRFQTPGMSGGGAVGWGSDGVFGTSTGNIAAELGTPAGGSVATAGLIAELPPDETNRTAAETTVAGTSSSVMSTQYTAGLTPSASPTAPAMTTGTVAGTPVGVPTETGGVGTYQGILPTNIDPPATGSGTGSYYSGGAGQLTGIAPPISGTTSTRDPFGQTGDQNPDNFLPISPIVNEAATGKVMTGFAYNTDNSLTGYVTVDEQNFDLLRFPRSWADIVEGRAWRGAGQKFRLELMPGVDVQRYSVTLRNPYLPILQRQLSGSVNAFYYDRSYSEWWEHRLGGRVELGYNFPKRPDLSVSLAFRGEQVKIDHVMETPTPIEDYERMKGNNSLYGFKLSFYHDVRNNSFLPTDGYYWNIGVEQVFGTFQYLQIQGDYRKYFLLKEHPDQTNRHVLSVLSHVGWTGNDTPAYDRFFLGGSTTMRGFRYRGASVRESQYQQVVGGNFLLYGSLEYLFPITANDQFRGLIFCDAGTSQPRLDDWTQKMRVAPGFGFRIAIPQLGPAPLALDFAFPVVKEDLDDKEIFSFTMGFFRY